jgi:hypothetical protein
MEFVAWRQKSWPPGNKTKLAASREAADKVR